MMKKKMLQNEDGIILVTSLVLLVILSLVGLMAMQASTVQERKAGNFEQRDIVFQRAESALQEIQAVIATWSSIPVFDGTGTRAAGTSGRYAINAGRAVPDRWWEEDNDCAEVFDPDDSTKSRYKYIIEYMGAVAEDRDDSVEFGKVQKISVAFMFRVTVRVVNDSSGAAMIIQSTMIRQG
ncbi:hypothetical protein LJC24_00770 [Desulfococcaceae bacterium OttesenSCG-928-F15]|nr:hypothetical protein [Desulfococcaceae bacterium OttesenSCG-928-F15]